MGHNSGPQSKDYKMKQMRLNWGCYTFCTATVNIGGTSSIALDIKSAISLS